MTDTFLWSRWALSHVKFGEDVQCTPAVGCENVVLFVCFFTGKIKFTHRPKIFFLPRKGDLLHRFTSNLARWWAHWSTWLSKISPQSAQRCGNVAPKYQKFPLFAKESPRRGDSLDRFRKFLGLLYAWLHYVSVSNFMWFASRVTELLRRIRASVN